MNFRKFARAHENKSCLYLWKERERALERERKSFEKRQRELWKERERALERERERELWKERERERALERERERAHAIHLSNSPLQMSISLQSMGGDFLLFTND